MNDFELDSLNNIYVVDKISRSKIKYDLNGRYLSREPFIDAGALKLLNNDRYIVNLFNGAADNSKVVDNNNVILFEGKRKLHSCVPFNNVQ